jgi:hypothetical protein
MKLGSYLIISWHFIFIYASSTVILNYLNWKCVINNVNLLNKCNYFVTKINLDVKIKVLCNGSANVEGEVDRAFVFSPSLRWRFVVKSCNRERCCYQKQKTVDILPVCYTCWSSSKCMLFCFCSTSACVCVCVWESNSTLKSEFQNGEF